MCCVFEVCNSAWRPFDGLASPRFRPVHAGAISHDHSGLLGAESKVFIRIEAGQPFWNDTPRHGMKCRPGMRAE